MLTHVSHAAHILAPYSAGLGIRPGTSLPQQGADIVVARTMPACDVEALI